LVKLVKVNQIICIYKNTTTLHVRLLKINRFESVLCIIWHNTDSDDAQEISFLSPNTVLVINETVCA